MNMSKKVRWFQENFPDIWESMEKCTHHYGSNINTFHVEGLIAAHSMMVCKMAEVFNENDLVQWACLLHDIGKPSARIEIPEKERARFINHEPISMFMAIDVLDKLELTKEDKITILRLIANHGVLFDFNKDNAEQVEKKILDLFVGERTFLKNLSHVTRCDTLGRFADESNDYGHAVVGLIEPIAEKLDDHQDIATNNKKMTVLWGLPASGKSTYIEGSDVVVISRDNLLMAMAEKMDITYNRAFHLARSNKNIGDEIDYQFVVSIREAKQSGKDIVVDMTNLTKKTRRRWINEFSNYTKECVVFLVGMEELKSRNDIRSQNGKTITDEVYLSMMKSATLPMYSEGFDKISYVVQ